jgi:hypothetical protein
MSDLKLEDLEDVCELISHYPLIVIQAQKVALAP